ncbi:hypothetical protein GOODEAATRI_017906 [Goodea atripinnis]|uniref:Uncharacterized protein n=1 Tax=Goodea atripinnis TaxID=208336 RepID=A0ABV0PPI2_9TELE
MPVTSSLRHKNVNILVPYLQNNLHVVRVPFALLVAPEFGAAVQERGDDARLLGVYRRRRDKRDRGSEGRGGVAEVSSGDGHGSGFAGCAPTAVNSRPEIPEGTKDRFRQHLSSYTLWSLTAGLEFVITQLKSLVLSLGMIDRHLSVEQAVLLSRLEEEYQVGMTQYMTVQSLFSYRSC